MVSTISRTLPPLRTSYSVSLSLSSFKRLLSSSSSPSTTRPPPVPIFHDPVSSSSTWFRCLLHFQPEQAQFDARSTALVGPTQPSITPRTSLITPLFSGLHDYEHWLIAMDKPSGEGTTKQQMIDCSIQIPSKLLPIYVVRKKPRRKSIIYHGLAMKLMKKLLIRWKACLPTILFVLPNSCVDPEHKDYGAELFVNREIVQRPLERQRRVEPVPQRHQDRPRYNDRTRCNRHRVNMR
ncbi:hypothetical protein Cgig2_014387 [Carnegiea gigantea]|uniref:MORF/ORRM1/DAG-like MORF domain-containing protein n=1 Tax=Carnegiea gigantea TaxID=171969 RepID=A0A9Q1JPS6_9CARY|nr:hypothetical protein Cgig2_014387 [Carnegiea gigantea]